MALPAPPWTPRRNAGGRWSAALLPLLLASCAPGVPDEAAEPPDGAAGPEDVEERVPAEVVEALAAGQPQDLLVRIDDGPLGWEVLKDPALRALPKDHPDLLAWKASRYRQMEEDLLGSLPREGYQRLRSYRNLPLTFLRVWTLDALDRLLADPATVRVYTDEPHEPSLTESLGLIGQPEVAASGRQGGGVTVAVLDTGLDYTLSAFGSCTSAGAPSSCKVAYAADFATSDGTRDDSTHHGTNVSGIVLGVAPSARIAALDVFRSDGLAYSSDILSAIDWVIDNKATYNIVAMNMSLGGGGYTAQCGSDVFASAISNARSAGVLSAIASGNNGYTSKVSSPACVPAAVSVGAVYDSSMGGIGWSTCTDSTTAADKVTCFSNSASFLTMLAPGALISAAGYQMGGTSQATPHVAGAIAVVRAAYPGETVDETVARLVDNGVPVTDSRNGITKNRLDLEAAVADCVEGLSPEGTSVEAEGGAGSLSVEAGSGCSWSAASDDAWITVTSGAAGTGSGTVSYLVAANGGTSRTGSLTVAGRTFTVSQAAGVDETAPAGTVSINAGATYSRSASVTLTLSASDASGVSQMCVSNSSSCSSWATYATSKSWTLSSGSGTRTVYVKFKDGAGNVSAAASDSIVIDSSAPSNGTLTAAAGNGLVDLSWSGFSDSGSGVSGYKLIGSSSASPSSSCSSGTVLYSGTSTSYRHSSLSNGTTWYYRLCALDNAGNTSSGATASAIPKPESTAPSSASVVINSGATYTRSTSVTLTLSASDASGVAQMCVSNGSSCSSWVTYATSKTWSISATAGTRTVSAWFKDIYGNVTSSPATDTIVYDKTAPSGGTLTAARGNGLVDLSWNGFSDSGSGLAGYKLIGSTSSSPASSCSSGTVLYSGTATSYRHSGLTNGTTWYYRLCALDNAGNTSSGATTSAIPAPETSAPSSASVVINSGAAYTNSASVTLALSASDASGVSQMCISNGSSCSSWVTYATSKTWSISATAGTRTVSAWFKDVYGNVTSSPATDTIVYDKTAPSGGTLTATAGSRQVTLSWSGFSDSGSGVSSYKVVYATGSTAPSSCSAGTAVYSGTGAGTTHGSLSAGTTYSYRVCAIDGAGNTSSGKTASAVPTN